MLHSQTLIRSTLLVLLLCGSVLAEEAPTKEAPKSPAVKGIKEDKIPRPRPITPPTAEELEASILKGNDFLVERQNVNGSWGSARRTKDLNITTPVPGGHHGLRAAVTSLSIAALIESGDKRASTIKSIERGETWLFKELPKVRRGSTGVIYNTWAHAYGLEALATMYDRLPEDKKRRALIKKMAEGQIDRLVRLEYLAGGWGYYEYQYRMNRPAGSPNSFTTATCVIAFDKAKRIIGVEIPEKMLNKAVNTIKRQRRPDHGYLYGERQWNRPGHPVSQPGGSLGRSQVCNLALRIYGDKRVTDQVMIDWLDRLFARNGWLDMGRKRPVPHESYYKVAGYFYYYGHYYAAGCIAHLPPAEQTRLKGHLAHTLMKLQEKTGCWWDYPLYDYHHAYGTALAIRTLVGCRATEETPASK